MQPQHELVPQGTHVSDGSVQMPPAVQGGAHVWLSQRQILPPVHSVSASQWFVWIGTHAATQSSQSGQLDDAHALHSVVGPHVAQRSPASHFSAQMPTPKRHTPPGQSSWDLHVPELEPVVAFVEDFDVELELPPVPSTISTSAAQPLDSTTKRITAADGRGDMR